MSRTLVRVPNWLGDFVMSLPALEAIRASDQVSSMGVWARPPLDSIVSIFFDEEVSILTDDEIPKRSSWDLLVLMTNSFGSALRGFRSGIGRRVGYRTEMRGVLLTDSIPLPPRGQLHHSVEYLRLAELAGIGHDLEEEHEAALPLPLAEGSAERHLAVFPGARYGPAKLWPAERFGSVAGELSGRTGLRPVFYGSRAEEGTARKAATECEGAALRIGLPLPELASSLLSAGLALGNDAGGTHLASALGVPSVVVFGSTSPDWTAPIGQTPHRVLSVPPECSPCYRRECRLAAPGDVPPCLDAVSSDMALSAAMELLGH